MQTETFPKEKRKKREKNKKESNFLRQGCWVLSRFLQNLFYLKKSINNKKNIAKPAGLDLDETWCVGLCEPCLNLLSFFIFDNTLSFSINCFIV